MSKLLFSALKVYYTTCKRMGDEKLFFKKFPSYGEYENMILLLASGKREKMINQGLDWDRCGHIAF
jgi:hypothetical protein